MILYCMGSSYEDSPSNINVPQSFGEKDVASRQAMKQSNLSQSKKNTGKMKQEKEQLYEAYNLLHSLAQVTVK